MQFKHKLLYFALVILLLSSCGENGIEDNQGDNDNADNGQAQYSDITETDENGNFISLDMDDWRDDSILEGCYAYPNPVEHYVIIQYKLLSDAYVLLIIRDSNGKRIESPVPCEPRGTYAGPQKKGKGYWCWDLRTIVGVKKIREGAHQQLYERVPSGIYRVFIYATDNEVISKQLNDTGVTNAPREKYSVVYGDIKIGKPPPPAKIEHTDPLDGGEMRRRTSTYILHIGFDSPVKGVSVNGTQASCQLLCISGLGKSWRWEVTELPKGIQKIRIKWINYDDTEGSHSITVTVK